MLIFKTMFALVYNHLKPYINEPIISTDGAGPRSHMEFAVSKIKMRIMQE